MEWRVYIRHNGKVFRIFKVQQNANEDITIIPHQSIYLDRKFLESTSTGDRLNISTQDNDAIIDHFSAHSASGQRHVKFHPSDKAVEPLIGTAFKNSPGVVPLITMVATTHREEDGEPSKGKWFGFEIPEDTDHCIFDL
jgi:hypothetical protein